MVHQERRQAAFNNIPPGAVRLTILVIDDEQAILLMLRDILEDEGYTVLMAKDGQEGFDRVLESRPDLILTDIMMPKMDGHTLCRHVRADPSIASIPLIAMSAAYRRHEGDSFDAIIAKPFDIVPLLELIQEHLGRAR